MQVGLRFLVQFISYGEAIGGILVEDFAVVVILRMSAPHSFENHFSLYIW